MLLDLASSPALLSDCFNLREPLDAVHNQQLIF